MSSDDRRDASAQSNRSRDKLLLGRRDYLQYTGAAAVGLFTATGGVAAQSDEQDGGKGQLIPRALRVEYERNPNNLEPTTAGNAERPRFSWVSTPDERASQQVAYRIVVSRARRNLQRNQGDVWDSGRVKSDESTNVLYGGEHLVPDQTYYWKVRVWDEDGNTSEWSDTSTFSMAIPDTDDQWKGDWIGADLPATDTPDDDERGIPPSPLLRREFDIDKEVAEARLHISGLGYNEPYLNGERVGENVLDPAITDYEETVLFTTYDVTGSVTEGSNVMGFALGRGRFGEPLENTWYWDETPWWSDPQLLVQLNLTYRDGTTASVVSDESWQVTDGPTRYDSLFDGEVYDAREEQPGWTTVGFDASDWDTATRVEEPEGELEPQQLPPKRTFETVSPVERSNPEEGVYVFDMGVMLTGWTRLTVEGPAGTEVELMMGEKLHDDGTVAHWWPPGTPEPIQDDVYILNGEGTETWESSFSYKGFRYVQVEGFPGTPTKENLEGVNAHSAIDVGVDSDFTCSNDLLNQIHENTRRALVNNHQGLPLDTPVYEKNGWTGDAQATAATAMYNFDMARFYHKWLRDQRDAQLKSGEVSVIVPTSNWSYEDEPGWGAVKGPVPGWDAAYFIIPWLMYQFNGDERALHKHYDPMKRYLEWFQGYFEGYIPTMGLGDWKAPGEKEIPISSTVFYYREVEILEKTARVLGHDNEAEEFEDLKVQIREAFNEEFYDGTAGYYGTNDVDTYVQTSNVLPLALGMVPDEREESVVDSLATDVMEEHDGHLYTGIFGTKHILPVLTEHGYHDVAYTIATQTTFPSWGHWVKNGMTALLESWPLDARSRDHHMFGSIDEWFYQYLAGVREPAEPGFENVEIAPEPVADLSNAKATVDTIRGEIGSKWELTDDGLIMDVAIPWNTTATVRIPTLGGDKVRVRESGKTIWNNGNHTRPNHPGVKDVECNGDWIIVEVGSGDYEFELEQIGRANTNGN